MCVCVVPKGIQLKATTTKEFKRFQNWTDRNAIELYC